MPLPITIASRSSGTLSTEKFCLRILSLSFWSVTNLAPFLFLRGKERGEGGTGERAREGRRERERTEKERRKKLK